MRKIVKEIDDGNRDEIIACINGLNDLNERIMCARRDLEMAKALKMDTKVHLLETLVRAGMTEFLSVDMTKLHRWARK